MILIMATSIGGNGRLVGEWKQLPSIPVPEGLAGTFTGISNGALLVAGGANFPDKKPWEGGIKKWYDSVFVLEKPEGQWKLAGKLPRSLGYGISVTHGNAVICVGGSDAERHHTSAFRLEWKGNKLITTELLALPKSLANFCGALVGNTLYVAGGIDSPSATATSKAIYRIDLAATKPKWEEVEECPGGGRMLAVACGFDGSFWLTSGVDLVAGKNGKTERRYLNDAYRYNAESGWTQVANLPHPVVAAPSPAPNDHAGFYVLGGDDGTQVAVAPDRHRGFSKKVLRYDLRTDQWLEAGEIIAPRVTVPCVKWGTAWVVPSGEVRPGLRSPEIWSFTPVTKQ